MQLRGAYDDKEKLIAKLFMGGAVSFGIGVVVSFLGILLGATIFLLIGPFAILVGIAMGVGGLLLGFEHNKVMNSGFKRPPQEGRIVARFAINGIGEMIFDN